MNHTDTWADEVNIINWTWTEEEIFSMMNWTWADEQEMDILKKPVWKFSIILLYVIIIIIGLVSNMIVIYIVARNKKLHNSTNIFIANLALSDIGLCVLNLPIQLYYQITDQWIFGKYMCRVISATFAVPMYASTLIMLLIALDRYWLIEYPLRGKMSPCMSLGLLLVSAVVSTLMAVPVIIYSTIVHISEPAIHFSRTICLEDWPHDTARLCYTVLTFLFQFCLPLVITAKLYHSIYIRLCCRPTNDRECNHTTNKVLVAIVMVFVICWLPWNLYSLLSELDRDLVRGPWFKFIDLLLKAFAMGSACINPLLYCCFNENFCDKLNNCGRARLHNDVHGRPVTGQSGQDGLTECDSEELERCTCTVIFLWNGGTVVCCNGKLPRNNDNVESDNDQLDAATTLFPQTDVDAASNNWQLSTVTYRETVL
jgi:neuropeptide Y receptor